VSDEEDIATIDDALAQPQSQSADGVSISERSIDDIRKGIQLKRDLEAASTPLRRLVINQIVPSGGCR